MRNITHWTFCLAHWALQTHLSSLSFELCWFKYWAVLLERCKKQKSILHMGGWGGVLRHNDVWGRGTLVRGFRWRRLSHSHSLCHSDSDCQLLSGFNLHYGGGLSACNPLSTGRNTKKWLHAPLLLVLTWRNLKGNTHRYRKPPKYLSFCP